MNGTSFGGGSHTEGRYGYVRISASLAHLFPIYTGALGLIWLLDNRQIYTLARVSALVCVILGIFLLDNTKEINCQVGTMSASCTAGI